MHVKIYTTISINDGPDKKKKNHHNQLIVSVFFITIWDQICNCLIPSWKLKDDKKTTPRKMNYKQVKR